MPTARLRLGVTYEKGVTLGNVTMSHRTRERPAECLASLSHSTMIETHATVNFLNGAHNHTTEKVVKHEREGAFSGHTNAGRRRRAGGARAGRGPSGLSRSVCSHIITRADGYKFTSRTMAIRHRDIIKVMPIAPLYLARVRLIWLRVLSDFKSCVIRAKSLYVCGASTVTSRRKNRAVNRTSYSETMRRANVDADATHVKSKITRVRGYRGVSRGRRRYGLMRCETYVIFQRTLKVYPRSAVDSAALNYCH
ncbi:hypothetical protein EVAR_98970_1 [Eumeta japonica]|uniref:Uncharacterized protein n=1 Tax=Eumeta variegata TaxID=151549 RepID=A0A4C1YSW2_EUMVA|nr:hypothetical protein EVAR_98970_1 [Eumeta japonica]